MAKFPPEVRRAMALWLFKFDLEDLDEAYVGALLGLRHREDEVEKMARSALGIGPHDDFPSENSDDPDDPITEIYERVGEQGARAKRGAHMVRKAFLIALFHLWERHRTPRCKVKENPDRLKINTLLDDLRHAANCAKHPPGYSASEIYNRRPDLFPRIDSPGKASEKSLVITENTMNEFFEAVFAVAEQHRTRRGPLLS